MYCFNVLFTLKVCSMASTVCCEYKLNGLRLIEDGLANNRYVTVHSHMLLKVTRNIKKTSVDNICMFAWAHTYKNCVYIFPFQFLSLTCWTIDKAHTFHDNPGLPERTHTQRHGFTQTKIHGRIFIHS